MPPRAGRAAPSPAASAGAAVAHPARFAADASPTATQEFLQQEPPPHTLREVTMEGSNIPSPFTVTAFEAWLREAIKDRPAPQVVRGDLRTKVNLFTSKALGQRLWEATTTILPSDSHVVLHLALGATYATQILDQMWLNSGKPQKGSCTPSALANPESEAHGVSLGVELDHDSHPTKGTSYPFQWAEVKEAWCKAMGFGPISTEVCFGDGPYPGLATPTIYKTLGAHQNPIIF